MTQEQAKPITRSLDELKHIETPVFSVESKPTLRVRTCEDLAVIPGLLLGFTPKNSIVVLVINKTDVELVVRIDIPDDNSISLVCKRIKPALVGCVGENVILVGYGEPISRIRHSVELLAQALGSEKTITETLCVAADRLWSSSCTCSQCQTGIGMEVELRTTPLAIEAILSGLSVADSREQLTRQLAGPKGKQLSLVSKICLAEAEQLQDLPEVTIKSKLDKLISSFRSSPNLVGLDGLAEAIMMVNQQEIFVYGLELIDDENAEEMTDFWCLAAQHCPADFSVPVRCLAGISSWVAGKGTVLAICANLIRESDEENLLGRLMQLIIERAVHPRNWPKVRACLVDASLLSKTG